MTDPNDPIASIAAILASIEPSAENDSAFLVAGAINLYSEALRRKSGRILFGPADVQALFKICTTLLVTPGESFPKETRSPHSTPEEEARVLTVTPEEPAVRRVLQ